MDVKNLYSAKVIDNNDNNHPDDPGRQGRVKIKIDSFMDGFQDAHLPWARPFNLFTGGSASTSISAIPENNSYIWVFFERPDLKKHPFYIADVSLKTLNSHGLFDTNTKSQIDGFNSSYPYVKFITLANGITIFASSDTNNKEVGIFHSANTYIFVNNSGEIILKAGSGTEEKMPLGESLQTLLDTFISKVLTHVHSSPVGPTGTMLPPERTDLTNLQSSDLQNILSTKVKNN